MKKYYVVIDTNVIISSLLSKEEDSATVKIMGAMYEGKIIPVLNGEILMEYIDVLQREKFGFPEWVIQSTLDFFIKYGLFVNKVPSKEDFIDPKDIVFYEVCLAKKDEDSYLVTGNKKHFPKKLFVVSPKELVEIIEKGE